MPTLKYYRKKRKIEISDKSLRSEKKSEQQIKLTKDIGSNIELIKNLMGYASDILVREFTI
jgi:spore germination protein KA